MERKAEIAGWLLLLGAVVYFTGHVIVAGIKLL